MEKQKIIISKDLRQSLTQAIDEVKHDLLFVLCDETTERLCLPVISDFDCMKDAQLITIPATDSHKTLESLSHVWSELQHMGATRHSFKRGIPYINIPTTLLSMVDASVGGKTGINFGGLKNEIGVFNNARSVILDTTFLRTMDHENICSGYAEMLKHGLINNEQMWAELLNFSLELNVESLEMLGRMVAESVAVKQRIVTEDPTEQGIRKALNLGHTAGHAFESLALERKPVLHGYAVAWGMIVELYLCCVKTNFPQDKMRQTVAFIKENYGRMAITCDDYPHLIELMHHDKKNQGNSINFTLLGGIGDIRINQTATEEEIKDALDFYRECKEMKNEK